MSNVFNLSDPVADGQTAAERILAEKKISGGYRFAPGITIHAPSKKTAMLVAAHMEGVDKESAEDINLVLRYLLGDQYQEVMDFLDDYPVEAYPALLEDLFVNLLKLVPHDMGDEDYAAKSESRMRSARPDLFASSE